MKNLKTSAKVSLIATVIACITTVDVMANDTDDKAVEKAKEAKYIAEMTAESDLDRMERELIDEGVILCDNVTIVKILGENDEVVYEGELTSFETEDIQLRKYMAKADFLLNVDNISFYRIF
ncbi:hypothetical protein GCM10011506_12260 [Marivirga lumbricoides]|uniref:BON domain-containing protein n=1 Tax=Marivirga lumbricoides TaxID=1046115 RepID=A0ABQ1LUL7_9BACT|nr:hypothetical protein GCM10011506_12260 [Marivirga lumbricoides]